MDSAFEFNDRGRGPNLSTHYSLGAPDFALCSSVFAHRFRGACIAGGLPIREKASQLYKDSYEGVLRMRKKMYDTGIPILAGIDATAGLMLHRELETRGTRSDSSDESAANRNFNAARLLKQDRELGAIEPEKLAGFLL